MSSPAEQLRLAAAQGALDQVRALLKAGAKVDPDLVSEMSLKSFLHSMFKNN